MSAARPTDTASPDRGPHACDPRLNLAMYFLEQSRNSGMPIAIPSLGIVIAVSNKDVDNTPPDVIQVQQHRP